MLGGAPVITTSRSVSVAPGAASMILIVAPLSARTSLIFAPPLPMILPTSSYMLVSHDSTAASEYSNLRDIQVLRL
jgi:hypothetical protein